MPATVDLLIYDAAQIVTCAADGPRRGAAMQDCGLITQGAIAVDDGRIVAVGDSADLRARYQPRQFVDASGRAVCPGFVDAHTHTVFGGDRAHEFELRIQGASYMEIMAAGGGIRSTMRHTRAASPGELLHSAAARLDEMLGLGSTTVEIKTGYGLDPASELKMLRVIEQLDQAHACDIIPTFLGAHTIPPEYESDPQGYVDLLIEEMIPAAAEWYRGSHFAAADTPFFIDVFCEDHAFDLAQTRRILEAGTAAGMRAKLHVDQFNRLGGVELAVELGATSADHLDVSAAPEIEVLAASQTVATLLPAVNFNLGLSDYAPGRALIDSGTIVALATDLNPGSAPCYSMPLVMAIATRYQGLLPAEAINAATLNAAHAVEAGGRLGSIEPGKQADLLILKAADYRHLPYFFGYNPVESVIKSGRLL